MGILSGVEWYGEYSAYHSNKVNIWIHIFCVPMIVFSLLLGGLAFPLDNSLLTPYIPALKGVLLPHAFVSIIFTYMILFSFLLEPLAGLIFDAEVVGMYVLSKYILQEYGSTNALYIAIAVHVFAWIIQFIGHGSYEKRAPALLTNVLQMFVAPTFVIIEVLFMFHYRPAFHKAINNTKRKYMPIAKAA